MGSIRGSIVPILCKVVPVAQNYKEKQKRENKKIRTSTKMLLSYRHVWDSFLLKEQISFRIHRDHIKSKGNANLEYMLYNMQSLN